MSDPLAIPNAAEKANRALAEHRREIADRILSGDGGLDVAADLRRATDRWVRTLWNEAIPARFADGVSLYATGGYGRDELAYHSDIDLLVAVDDEALTDDGDFSLAIERLMAWSRPTGLKLSHVVRTAAQTRTAVDADRKSAIALLDLRSLDDSEITGAPFSAPAIREHLGEDDGGRRFVAELVDGLRRRSARHGKTVYLLEPDAKSGVGGLRDLNRIGWAARVRWNIDVRTDTRSDIGWTDRRRRDFCNHLEALLSLRNRLHLLRDRKHDRLGFREQEALVRLIEHDRSGDVESARKAVERAMDDASSTTEGHRQSPAFRRAVETMMRDYYRRARAISQTTERLLRRWATYDRSPPQTRGRFVIRGESLDLADGAELDGDAVFDALQLADEQRLLLAPQLESHIESQVDAWPEGDDVPSELATRLRDLLVDPSCTDRTPHRLLDLGILTRIVPEFSPLVCHVQHDLYHVFTTDVHSLKCLGEAGRLLTCDPDDHPRPSFCHIASRIEETTPFLLAALFHDIGKNRGGDHSERGAAIMRDVGPRLGLDTEQTERLEKLVLHHLALSTSSRRRDISDPEILDELADDLDRSVEFLNQLTALTHCDMATVGPDVLDDWSASLLLDLYGRLHARITSAVRPDVEPAEDRDLRRLAEAVGEHTDRGVDEIRAFFDRLPDDHTATTEGEALARQFDVYSRALEADDGVAVSTRPIEARSATEVIVSGPDRPGILARIAGAITSVGINIMAADVITTDDGRTLDIFFVSHFNPRAVPPARPRPVDAPNRLEKLETRIREVLAGDVDVDRLVERRHRERRLPPRPVPAVSTEVRVDPDASSRSTVLEIRAPDRRGLLYAIARTLHDCGVSTRVSRIDSLGHQAIDAFYVEELDGSPLSEDRTTEVIDALRTTLAET